MAPSGLAVEKVHTDDNLADTFTKVLDRTPYTKLRRLVMNLLVRAATAVVPRARWGRTGGLSMLRRLRLRGNTCIPVCVV